MRLLSDASPWDPDEIQAFTDAIPDLSSGSPSLGDELAALEWKTTLLPLLMEANMADTVLIDLRGLKEQGGKRTHVSRLQEGLQCSARHHDLSGLFNLLTRTPTTGGY